MYFNSTVVQLEDTYFRDNWSRNVFQFYCSPIRSLFIFQILVSLSDFNSTVVQLEDKGDTVPEDAYPFQFYCSPIRSKRIKLVLTSKILFQFYCSPIRRKQALKEIAEE